MEVDLAKRLRKPQTKNKDKKATGEEQLVDLVNTKKSMMKCKGCQQFCKQERQEGKW